MSMAIELPPPSPRMPAVPTSQATVIALVMVRVPKPPESTQLISPPALVAAMAAAKVLQGAARLQVGLRSSPTPETQVRGFCACAGAAARRRGGEERRCECDDGERKRGLTHDGPPSYRSIGHRVRIEPDPNRQQPEISDKPTAVQSRGDRACATRSVTRQAANRRG